MTEDSKLFECECGIHLIKVNTYYPEVDDIFISFYEDAFYSKQGDKRFLGYLKRLWHAIKGKEHLLFEVVLNQKKAKELGVMLLAASNLENDWHCLRVGRS